MRQDLYDRIVDYIVENQDKFYRLAYSYVHNKEDALDIVQSAVCKALENYTSLRNENAVRTWFYRILVNESLLLLKNKKRELPSADDLNTEVPYYEKGYEKSDDLYDEINQLDAATQKIIKLRFYEELSLQEISEITEMKLSTVKSRLYRGLKLLKQNIKEVSL